MKKYNVDSNMMARYEQFQAMSLASSLYFSMGFFYKAFIAPNTNTSINYLTLLAGASLMFFIIAGYFKVRVVCCNQYADLKVVSDVQLDKCLESTKKIVIWGEIAKVNIFACAVLVVQLLEQIENTQSRSTTWALLLVSQLIYIMLKFKIARLKAYQLSLYFPEVNAANQKAQAERKALEESEKHLPWLKRSF